MTTYTDPFTAQTISPSQVSYEALTISTNTVLTWPINGNTGLITANIIEVTATTTGLLLALPTAYQVSVGQAIIVRNVGSNLFTVTDTSGNTIIAIPPGSGSSSINTYYIYLTNNSTANGIWSNIAMGAGTSSASASTLAGYGLTAITSTLNTAYPVTLQYSSITLAAANRASFYVWSGGVGTFTLPSSTGVGNNWFVIIKNNGTGIVTISPAGTDTIDGNASQQLQLAESIVVVSNGSTGYDTFGYGRSNSFAYTQLALSLAGLSSPYTYTLSSAQGSNTIQIYSGALTANTTVVIPSTVQLYSITNNTTGSYTLTIKTAVSGGTSITVGQGNTYMVVCDGTNVYNANSLAISTGASLTLAVGSATSPTLNFLGSTTTGLYAPGSNQIGFTLNGVSAGIMSSTGFQLPIGIVGGAF